MRRTISVFCSELIFILSSPSPHNQRTRLWNSASEGRCLDVYLALDVTKNSQGPIADNLPTTERPEPIEEAASDCNALPSRDNADPPSPALKLRDVDRPARFPCHLDQ